MADDTIKTSNSTDSNKTPAIPGNDDNAEKAMGGTAREKEIGGRDGPDPTRYGDWEKAGRCIDF